VDSDSLTPPLLLLLLPPDYHWYSFILTDTIRSPRGWQWISIGTTTTTFTNPTSTGANTDDGYWAIPLPFTFTFLGNDYTTVYVSTNTYLTFGSGDYASGYQSLTAAQPPQPTVFIAAADNSAQRMAYLTDGSTFVCIRWVVVVGEE